MIQKLEKRIADLKKDIEREQKAYEYAEKNGDYTACEVCISCIRQLKGYLDEAEYKLLKLKGENI